jgi:uncharacterized protein (TIGR03000 family)
MYSVVLVMALAGGAEAPDCHCGHVGHGCNGGGYGCGGYGCAGYGCGGGYGCAGYGCGGGGGCCGLLRACFSCCNVRNCGGCGGYGGCGGCVGYGGCGGGCAGMYYGPGGGVIMTEPAKTMPSGEKIGQPVPDKKLVSLPAPATIVVTLPADARLSIDGYVSTQTSAQRRLVTPAIQPGQEFTYTLVAETTQDGQTVSQSQRVTVRAGQQMPVNFNFTAVPTSESH